MTDTKSSGSSLTHPKPLMKCGVKICFLNYCKMELKAPYSSHEAKYIEEVKTQKYQKKHPLLGNYVYSFGGNKN